MNPEESQNPLKEVQLLHRFCRGHLRFRYLDRIRPHHKLHPLDIGVLLRGKRLKGISIDAYGVKYLINFVGYLRINVQRLGPELVQSVGNLRGPGHQRPGARDKGGGAALQISKYYCCLVDLCFAGSSLRNLRKCGIYQTFNT